ncbi:MAG: hypothetical protein ABI678_22870 [Kofleriaceae bacterium]
MVARALILGLLAACAGPSPVVDHVAVAPSPVPGHVRVTGTLLNRAGAGSVELHVELRGKTLIRADKMIDVHEHEQVELAIDVAAQPGDYTATIEPEYPN